MMWEDIAKQYVKMFIDTVEKARLKDTRVV